MPEPSAHIVGLHELCKAVERELRDLMLWSDATPVAEALNSTAPFAYDTLPFESWLQWILLPRIQEHLDAGRPLPGHCEVAPMVEVTFAERDIDYRHLAELLERLDAALNQWRVLHS